MKGMNSSKSKIILILVALATLFTALSGCRSEKERESDYVQFLYGSMPLPDSLVYPREYWEQNVAKTLEVRERMKWDIPEREFRHFVLPVRVNNENLDDFRLIYADSLCERVEGMTMEQAALEINHWCHERMTYIPSDGRTLGPMASIRSGLGRCGEESVLAVAALRAAGLPARQVYTPRWAHTDDNHAWVEVYVNGAWHFMGACEPEPVLDMGWFNSSVSRAMLLHTKAFGNYDGPEDVISRTPAYTEINVIRNYVPTRRVTVTVKDSAGNAVPDANLEFKIYNYAEFYTVAKYRTDEKGQASLETGLGDIVVWASKDDRFGIAVASADSAELVLDKTFGEKYSMDLDIVPPVEKPLPSKASEEQIALNAKRLEEGNTIRESREHPKTDVSAYFLTKKDEIDISSEVLKDTEKGLAILFKTRIRQYGTSRTQVCGDSTITREKKYHNRIDSVKEYAHQAHKLSSKVLTIINGSVMSRTNLAADELDDNVDTTKRSSGRNVTNWAGKQVRKFKEVVSKVKKKIIPPESKVGRLKHRYYDNVLDTIQAKEDWLIDKAADKAGRVFVGKDSKSKSDSLSPRTEKIILKVRNVMEDKYVVSPRVELEMLRPYRCAILSSGLVDSLLSPAQVARWVKDSIRIVDSRNPQELRIPPVAVWESRISDRPSQKIFFVAMCRTLGFAARMDEVTSTAQYRLADGSWVDVDFDSGTQEVSAKGRLQTSYNAGGSPLKMAEYYKHYTLSQIYDGSAHLCEFNENETVASVNDLNAGYYLMTSGNRMADGSVLAHLEFFNINAGSSIKIPVVLRSNDSKLAVIGSLDAEQHFLPENAQECSILSATGRGYFMLCVFALHNEPSIHAAQQMSAMAQAINDWGRKVIVLGSSANGEDGILPEKSRPQGLENVVFGTDIDGRIASMIRSGMHSNSANLPLIVVADSFGRIIYFSQGYNTSLEAQLLKALSQAGN